MTEPIFTPTVIVSGASAWLAAKIFGPSAARLGDNLLVYLESRLPRIFAEVEKIARENGIDPQPIRPGLLTRLIVDASMSEDDEGITEWWANLILDASVSGSNEHAVFSDMMTLLGPSEAEFLGNFYALVADKRPRNDEPWHFSRFIVEHTVSEFLARGIGWKFPVEKGEAEQARKFIENFKAVMPAIPVAWGIPSKGQASINQGEPFDFVVVDQQKVKWFAGSERLFEVLETSRILRISRHQIPSMRGRDGWVELLEFTQLGMAFYEACSGLSRNWEHK